MTAREDEDVLDDEVDLEDLVPQEYSVVADMDDVAYEADPGAEFPLHLSITNDGTRPDAYTLSTESRWLTLPPSFALEPGETRTLDLTVKVPANLQPGTFEDIEIEARSAANPLVLDSASTDVTVAGTIPSTYETGSTGGSGCFIATAAYGSYLDPHVVTLRHFRDDCLLSNPVGRPLVGLYYRLSPPLARQIQASSVLRWGTLAALTPVVAALEHPLAALAALGLAGYGLRRRRIRRGWTRAPR